MQHLKWIVAIGGLAPGLALSMFLFVHQQGNAVGSGSNSEDEASAAVNGLWSPDPRVRENSKLKILQFGQGAIPPLMSLLNDLANNPSPRFATGREEEGMKEWRRIQSIPFDQQTFRELDKLQDLEITSRLYRDSLDLLGRLHAEEAVTLVVRLMSTDGMLVSKKNEEMQALAQIGPAAVPKLLEVIETSDETLASTSYWMGQSYQDSPEPRGFRFIPRLIRSRAIMTLGKIGDLRALPILEKLLTTTRDKDLSESLEEAIKRLKTRPR